MASLLSGRLRARLIETLELIADAEGQLRYQVEVPDIAVPAEIFNQWDDVYHPASPEFRAGFDASELTTLASFEELLTRIANQTPQRLPPLRDFIQTDEWRQLAEAAKLVLASLAIRK